MYICSPKNEEKCREEREILQKMQSLASAASHAALSALPRSGGVEIARDTRIAVGVPPTIPNPFMVLSPGSEPASGP